MTSPAATVWPCATGVFSCKLLYWVAFAHYQGGDNNYPDQNEFWNEDNNNVGDVNGDGAIDSDDSIYLLRYTFDPDLFPIAE